MFYDLEHPRTFVADVAEALADGGIWVIELHYLPMMLEANAFDAIVHEHLEYYSLAVIERLVGEEGLEVVVRRAQRHERRLDPAVHRTCRPAHSAHPSSRGADGAAGQGVRAGARLTRALRGVPAAAQNGSATISSRCASELHGEGKKIHVYGASTKGNTILQYAGIDST